MVHFLTLTSLPGTCGSVERLSLYFLALHFLPEVPVIIFLKFQVILSLLMTSAVYILLVRVKNNTHILCNVGALQFTDVHVKYNALT